MTQKDKCCTIVPYFSIKPDKIEAFKSIAATLVEKTANEEKCLFYGFTYNGTHAHCREGYADADGALEHIENLGTGLQDLLRFSDLTRMEIHGPKEELDKLKAPLAPMKPDYFELEIGFRR